MTREVYLQQRQSTAQVFRRKAIAPGVLLLFSFIVMTWMQRNKMQPSTWNELVLYCLPLASFVIFLVWATVIGLRDDKLNLIRCASCGKNNGNERASRWLIASGNCFYCRAKMFEDNPATMNTADDKPLISRAEFKERLKATASQLNKMGLLVSAPLTVFLVWMAFQSSNLANLDHLTASMMLLFLITGILLVWFSFRIEKQSGAKCTNCGSLPRYHTKIILATGGCTSCGHRIFNNQ